MKKERRFRGSRDADNLSHDYRITCIINELPPDTRLSGRARGFRGCRELSRVDRAMAREDARSVVVSS